MANIKYIDIWSSQVANVTLGVNAGESDVALPDVVIPADLLPTSATILRVVTIVKVAVLRDTSGSDNAVNGATYVQVRKSGGSWVNAITIPDDAWAIDVSTSPDRGGDVVIGSDDIKTTVNSDEATYNFQFVGPNVDGDSLLLLDVMVGLRIYFN